MSHYKLIHDREQLQKFGSIVCSDLSAGENASEEKEAIFNDSCKMMLLLAREKYVRGRYRFPRDGNMHLERKLITNSDPEYLVCQMSRYESPIGSYTYYSKESKQNEAIPNEAMCVYMTLESKSLVRAWLKQNESVSEDLLYLAQSRQGKEDERSQNCVKRLNRLMSNYKSTIHSTNAIGGHVRKFMDIDIDLKSGTILDLFIAVSIQMIIETHNGFHVIVDKKQFDQESNKKVFHFLQQYNKSENMYQENDRNGKIVTKYWIIHNSKPIVPCPGTLQGGFPVRMITIEDFISKKKAL